MNRQKTCILLLTSILIFLSLPAKSQDVKFTNVTGYVLDTAFKPIEYAAVQFISHDTLHHRSFGTVTNASGTYVIKKLPLGTYQVSVSAIGYKTETFEAGITKRKLNTSMKLVRLKEDIIEIEEIQVRGERKGITERVDKMVFIPDSFVLETSRTGLDVLRRIPEVTVRKKDRSVKVMGSSNILILVNGIDNGRNIEAISPNDIKRIEVITHPSVKYRSDVTSVINIILKGYVQDGISINSNLYYCLNREKHSGHLNVDYQKGKWRYFISYYGNFSESESKDTTFRYNYDENGARTFESVTIPINNNTTDSYYQKIQFGSDYAINKNNLLSYTTRLVFNNMESNRSLLQVNRTDENILKNIFLDTKYMEDKTEQNHSVYYKHNFNEHDYLTINSNFYLHSGSSEFVINDSTITQSMGEYTSRRVINAVKNQSSINIRTDYTRELTTTLDLNIGHQFYQRSIETENWQSDAALEEMNFKEYRNAGYAGLTSSNNKIGYEAGLRLEHFHVNANRQKANSAILMPYASLFIKPNPQHSLKMLFRQSLNYPSMSFLNPYKYYFSDSLSYVSGNPELVPEKKYMANMKYVYRQKQNFLSTSIYSNYTTDIIAADIKLEDDIIAYKYRNIGKAFQYGINFSFSTVLFNWLEFEAQASTYYTNYLNREGYNGFSYTVDLGMVVPLPMGFDLEVYGFLVDREIEYTGYSNYGGYIDEILLTKDITKHMFLGIAVWQPFFQVKDTYKQWNPRFSDTSYSYEVNSQFFLINLTYFFKSGKKIDKVQNELHMETESSKGIRRK